MARTRPLVHNRDLAVYGGALLWLAGTVLLWDAYNNRGRSKPLALRIVGALA